MALDDTELPEPYRLSFLIGEICRRNVWVENELRRLAYAFDESPVNSPKWESDYGRMLPQLVTTASQSAVPEPFRRLVAQVANLSITENRNRNRFAHDLWIEIPRQVSPIVGLSPRRGREEVDVEDFRRCAAELARLVARARGLWIIAPSWIGPAADWQNADDLRSWTRVSMGHIADNASAMRGTPGACPEPPGGYVSIGPQ